MSKMDANIFYNWLLYIPVHTCDRSENGGCEQECKKKGDDSTCWCKDGYRLKEDGKKCEKSKQKNM